MTLMVFTGLVGFSAAVGAVTAVGELASPDRPKRQSGALWTAVAVCGLVSLALLTATAIGTLHGLDAAAARAHGHPVIHFEWPSF